MTAITREQAKDLRNAFEGWQQDYDPVEDKEQYDMFGRGMVAMDMLIAGMYQEPVGEFYEDGPLNWYQISDGDRVPAHRRIPLYRHAQQPVVQCPFPCGWDNLNRLTIQDAAFVARGLVEGEPATESIRQAAISNNDRLLKVISACRAAMLQGKAEQPQNAQQNIPGNIPGWIKCSERMPDDEQHVIIFCDGAFVLNAQYRDGEFFDVVRDGDEFFETSSRGVTHWMPLPAAPQQEK